MIGYPHLTWCSDCQRDLADREPRWHWVAKGREGKRPYTLCELCYARYVRDEAREEAGVEVRRGVLWTLLEVLNKWPADLHARIRRETVPYSSPAPVLYDPKHGSDVYTRIQQNIQRARR